ncbi:hypothetical protein CH063_01978 [Colletotrichum higginsianum]|uniref:Uncharacterized protein n=1 Tax=Colletotrichum higginsianum (strain IMI 349063) TaxID=759273 RepID=H1VEW7_COLHI|nr:hypothetical protein CH063_01978 [Colletotrichum higginsianum]
MIFQFAIAYIVVMVSPLQKLLQRPFTIKLLELPTRRPSPARPSVSSPTPSSLASAFPLGPLSPIVLSLLSLSLPWAHSERLFPTSGAAPWGSLLDGPAGPAKNRSHSAILRPKSVPMNRRRWKGGKGVLQECTILALGQAIFKSTNISLIDLASLAFALPTIETRSIHTLPRGCAVQASYIYTETQSLTAKSHAAGFAGR